MIAFLKLLAAGAALRAFVANGNESAPEASIVFLMKLRLCMMKRF